MNILVYDNDNLDRAKALARALSEAKAHATVCCNGRFSDVAGNALAAEPHSFDLVLWHKTNETAFRGSGLLAKCTISFSGGSGAEIMRGLSAAGGFTQEEASHIVESLESRGSDVQIKERVLAYWSAYRAARYALQLLCEAWMLNREEKETGTVINASQSHNGIVVNAPISPDRWFVPFIEGFERVPVSEKMNVAEKAVSNIASQMGVAEGAVESFLKGLAGLYAGPGLDVTCARFDDIIQGLSAKLRAAIT